MKGDIMNTTVAWYGNGSMDLYFSGPVTEDNFNYLFDFSKTNIYDVCDKILNDEPVPFNYLNDNVKDSVIEGIKNGNVRSFVSFNDLRMDYDFNADIIIREADCERNREGCWMELSDNAKEAVFESIIYKGKENSQIWCDGPVLDCEVDQSLDDKLDMARKAVSGTEKAANKELER